MKDRYPFLALRKEQGFDKIPAVLISVLRDHFERAVDSSELKGLSHYERDALFKETIEQTGLQVGIPHILSLGLEVRKAQEMVKRGEERKPP